jgi:hypothetical protein
MKNFQSRGYALLGYLATGIVAGLATCASPRLLVPAVGERLFRNCLGGVFGLILVLYEQFLDRQFSFFRAFTFVISSGVAYFTAEQAAELARSYWPPIHLPLLNLDPNEAKMMIGGGLAGAFVLFPAFYFLFARGVPWDRFAVKLALAVLSGAVLGIIGWSLWSSIGAGAWQLLRLLHLGEPSQVTLHSAPEDTAHFYSLYIVWQSGFALLLGILCPTRRDVVSSGFSGT